MPCLTHFKPGKELQTRCQKLCEKFQPADSLSLQAPRKTRPYKNPRLAEIEMNMVVEMNMVLITLEDLKEIFELN